MDRNLRLLILLTPLSLLACEEPCRPSAHRIHSTDSDYNCGVGTVVIKDENFILCQCVGKVVAEVVEAGVPDAGTSEAGN